MIKQSLYQVLSGNAGIAALVSSRIYPEILPQMDFDASSNQPSIVFTRQSVRRSQTLCATDDLTNSIFRVTSFGLNYEQAESVASAVREALLDYRGFVAGVTIKTAALDSEFDGADLEPGLYRVDQLWSIWHDGP